jgi:hypothetical protein
MRIVCAWCEKEGKSALICEIEPFDDPMETHGICVAHRASFLAELARDRSPRAAAPAARAGEDPDAWWARQPADTRRLLGWITEGQELVRQAIPRLAEQVSALEARCQAAEQVQADMLKQVTDARQRLAALQAEIQRRRDLQGEILSVLDPLIERVLGETVRPLYRLSRALRARQRRVPPAGAPPRREDLDSKSS